MSLNIPEELQGDLSGWRFMTVYKVDKPCPHGACCEVHGYYAQRVGAEAAVRKLFVQSGEAAYKTLIDAKVILTKDGLNGFLLGSDVLRANVKVRQPRKPTRKKPELRLV